MAATMLAALVSGCSPIPVRPDSKTTQLIIVVVLVASGKFFPEYISIFHPP